MLQRKVDELVGVDGRWAVMVRLECEPVTRVLCHIHCLYPAAGVDRIFPDGIGELWRIYGDDPRGRRGGYDGIESGRSRYYESRVFGVENKISTSKEDFSRSRYDCGGHCTGACGLGRGNRRFAGVEIVP